MGNEAREETIVPIYIEDEMKKSYMDYAMSVIVGRALPDVRDGLKPVHRRILYAMHEAGITSTKPYKKSARIVGDVLGKYHPHGDIAVYDALVRMVQDFSLRYPLIDGQGNFGSVDGDAAAAMRYTEVRMGKIAEELLADIDKDTVDFVPNYDGSLKEPVVLPSKLPNLLINGSSGIAVGMATNIPPHNLGEVINGIIMLIDDPSIGTGSLMKVIKGPDFPTGGIILGKEGIGNAYNSGRGSIKVRARVAVEEDRIIVTEIPYQVNKARLIEDIARLVRNKKIEGISDLRDESDREGMRIVIELKSKANADVLLNQLYRHTAMESTFGMINLAIVDGEPHVLTLKNTLRYYIEHRKEVVRRRSEFELNKAEKRAHILEGLKIALDHIDEIIKLIKRSKTPEDARNALVSSFKLSMEQAQAILDMKLQRLTGLEREKIDEEYKKLLETIAWLKEILASDERILGIIKEELLEIKNNYGDERKTEISEEAVEYEDEDLIPKEDVVVTITNTGYIKRIPVSTYRKQRRGGKGVIGMETKEEDFVEDLFIASTHDYMLFFTNKGRVYWKKVYYIPSAGRYSRGKAVVNLLNIEEGESISAMIPISKFDEEHYLVFATKKGTIKKTVLSAYSRPRKTGIWAITLVDEDEVIGVRLTDGGQELILGTKFGKAIRFAEKDVRNTGRTARGVRGIRLRKKDEVIAMEVVEEESILLTITENGYGKRTPIKEYRKTRRGGKGIINIKTSKRNGPAVGIKKVNDEDELIITSSDGKVIRLPVKDISVISRNTQGVRMMRLNENEKAVAIARLARGEEESV